MRKGEVLFMETAVKKELTSAQIAVIVVIVLVVVAGFGYWYMSKNSPPTYTSLPKAGSRAEMLGHIHAGGAVGGGQGGPIQKSANP